MAKGLISEAMTKLRYYNLTHEPWSLWYNKRKNLQPSQTVYGLVHSLEAWDYWCKSGPRQSMVIDTVNWEAIGRAFKGVGRNQEAFISKLLVRNGVGKRMKWWKKWEHDHCPRGGELEDVSHIT
jgi:hypothetical protein